MATNGSVSEHHNLVAIAPNGVTLLTFHMAGQTYGLPVTAVRQLIEMVTIIELPQATPAIRGVINVRGQIVPVMDLRLRFGLAFMPYQLHTPIILVEVNGRVLGLVVDEVETIIEIAPGELQSYNTIFDSKANGTFSQTAYLSAVAKVQNQIVPILDVNRILHDHEEAKLAQLLADREILDTVPGNKPTQNQEPIGA